MSLSSLPSYPQRPGQGPAAAIKKTDPGLSPRASRILLELTVVAALAMLLPWLRVTARRLDARLPLPFAQIQERFPQVRLGAGREEVEALLGPPSERGSRDPELEEGRWNRYAPKERIWERWIDPQDPSRWVAVLYAGALSPDTVYRKHQHGQ